MVLVLPLAVLRLTVAGLTLLAQDQQPPAMPATGVPPAVEITRPDPAKRAARPLTPAEERERAIRLYDPLNRANPRGEADRTLPGAENTGSLAPQIRRAGSLVPSAPPAINNPMSAGPQIVSDAPVESPAQDYSGPSVLSRSYAVSLPSSSSRFIRWEPILGFSTLYNTGLGASSAIATPIVSPTIAAGQAATSNTSFGTQLSWGLSATHQGKRDVFQLRYFASQNSYFGAQAYNGANQSLNLTISHAVTRHLVLHLTQALLSTTQGYALQNQTGPLTDSLGASTLSSTGAVGLTDEGTRQFSSSAGATWQKTSRTSMSGSGGVFFVQRSGVGFSGTTGQQAQGSLNRRFTRRLTVGTYYSYSSYLFGKHTAVSNSNTLGGSASYLFGRSTQASLQYGVTSVETESLSVVRLDPVIAQILGQATGIVDQYTKSRLSNISASLSHDLGHHRVVQGSYSRGVAPGNGLIQTSSRETLNAAFSMTIFRHYSFNAGFSKDRLVALDAGSAAYASSGAQFSISRSLMRGLASNFSVDYRKISGLGSGGVTGQLRITSGISWGRTDGKLW